MWYGQLVFADTTFPFDSFELERGRMFSRDPGIGLLQCSGKRKNMAGNGRKRPEKVGYGKKRDGI